MTDSETIKSIDAMTADEIRQFRTTPGQTWPVATLWKYGWWKILYCEVEETTDGHLRRKVEVLRADGWHVSRTFYRQYKPAAGHGG